ncbi:MAG: membrane dipeptidase [Bacteroidetes bacterium]|nr:membrane dipeptidase [Bacteroidota bacterium]
MQSRRAFLKKSAAASCGMALLGFGAANAESHVIDYPTFDFHCHPGLFPTRGVPGFAGEAMLQKTVKEMNEGKLSGAFFSLVADLPNIRPGATGIQITGSYKPGDGWKEYKRQLAIYKDILAALPVRGAVNAADLDNSFKEHRVAAFLSCEGGDFIEGSSDRIDEMYADGVRSIQLVHYHPNELGDLQTEAPAYNGLSSAGKDAVRKMNKLGMVIDVAHATYETTKTVCELSTKPVILSHSILKLDDSRPLAKRAITKEHAKVVAETGGVIGAWPSGFNTSFDDFVENTLKLIEVVGADHVGLGTDMDGNFKPVLNSYLQLDSWAAALQAKGLSREETAKVLGGNARRVLLQVLR